MTITRRALLEASVLEASVASTPLLRLPLVGPSSIASASTLAGCARMPADLRPAPDVRQRPSPDGRPPPDALPAGLHEGQQQPWVMPDIASVSDLAKAPYRRMQIAIPNGYAATTQPRPLLVFLHGAGERGFDIEDVKRCGPPMLAARGTAYPMVVCSPQVDPNSRWEPLRLHALVAALGFHFNIDRRRILATGLSLGGSGSWRWACSFPDDLAAIAPVCGYVDTALLAAMRSVPVRAYHGDQDPLVPLERQQACVNELRRLGGIASLTIYRGVGHDAWTPAYEDAGLLPWLLAQRNGNRT